MRTREMMGIVVMFHEHGLIVSQSILFAEQSPDAVSVIRIAAVKLNLFEFGKLLDYSFIDDQPLIAVLAWSFVLMLTDSFF